MRKALLVQLAAILVLGLVVQAAPARTGSPVTIQETFNVLEPGETAVTVVQDPSGVLCPTGIGGPAPLPGDESRGPQPRGHSDRFVGTALVLVTCEGEGWDASDTYTIRITVKGTGPVTAEGTWSIVAATGRLVGLHGGGDYSALIDPIPIVNNTYTGTVHVTP